jgi:hypothetical protein
MKGIFLRTVLIILAILPSITSAQSPRKVLIETFSNASSNESRRQDAIFGDEFMQRPFRHSRIVPLGFHTGSPGWDEINAGNRTLHNTRTAFYGITQVPALRINGAIPVPTGGHAPGSPADTDAVKSAVAALDGTMSPITITISSQVADDTLRGTVRVTTSEALAGKRLYVVAVEPKVQVDELVNKQLFDVRYVPLKIYPDEKGSDLTLAAGETREIIVSHPVDYVNVTTAAYIVAFVQDTATKEVLQAEHSTNIPSIATDSRTEEITTVSGMHEWTGSIGTTQTSRCRVSTRVVAPEGWSHEVIIDGTTFTGAKEIDFEGGVPKSLRVRLIPSESSPCRKGYVSITIYPPGNSNGYLNRWFTLVAGHFETLLVIRDAMRGLTLDSYSYALDSIGRTYAYCHEEPEQEKLFDFSKHVLVFTAGKTVLSPDDVARLRTVLENGGRMLLMGPEIGYGIADPFAAGAYGFSRDTAFLHDYLHAGYVQDDGMSRTVYGVGSDPVADGKTLIINDPDANSTVQNNDTPDELEPRDGATPIFYYDAEMKRVAGIRYADGRNRLIYLGFGIEGIPGTEEYRELLRRSIEWLTTASSVEKEEPATAEMLGAPWPNPVWGSITIPIALKGPAHADIALYDMRGVRVATIAEKMFAAGPAMLRFDLSGLPAGAYRLVLRSEGRTDTELVTVAR